MAIVHLNAPNSDANAIRWGPGAGAAMSDEVEAVPAGAATLVWIGRRTSGGDALGIADRANNRWYHTIGWTATPALWDDDGLVGVTGATFSPASTDLVMIAMTMPATGTTENLHAKNITTGAAAVHSANLTNGGKRTMAGTTNHILVGSSGSNGDFTGDLVCAAIWDVQMSNAQVDECWANSKTADLYSNSAGPPSWLVEGNSLTLTDLMGGTSLVGVGTATLTGTDAAWTYGIGPPPPIQQPYQSAMKQMSPSGLYL